LYEFIHTDSQFSPLLLSLTGNLAAGETMPSLVTNIGAGKGEIRFRAAGLNTENDGDSDYGDNPLRKITCGQFRGNDRMLYWQEIVR
jgi:hypothetical protein